MNKHILRIFLLLTFFLLAISSTQAQHPVGDLLIYWDTEQETPVAMVYNPAIDEAFALPISSETQNIVKDNTGRIAYVQDNDVWVIDVLNAPDTPVRITSTPDEEERFLRWTPDGRILEYYVGSYPGHYILYHYDGDKSMAVDYGHALERHWNENGWYLVTEETHSGLIHSVWNGQERLELVFPPLASDPIWHRYEWTPDNHLFIIIGYEEPYWDGQLIGLTDIFYWNGESVHRLERPLDGETFLIGSWSNDNQLLFSVDNPATPARWYIWDGISFTTDSLPDMTTLTAINNETERISSIVWMPDGRLALTVSLANPEANTLLGHPFSCPEPCIRQVYLWDEQSLTQVTYTENDYMDMRLEVNINGEIIVTHHNGMVSSAITVYDRNLDVVFGSGGPYSLSRWSADGVLAFCSYDDLLVWNGEEEIRLSRRTYAFWLMSDIVGITCSTY